MLLNLIINIIYIKFSKQDIINGVYTFLIDDLYLYYYKRNISTFHKFIYPNTFFRIVKVLNNNNNEIFYNIEDINTNSKLSFLYNKELTLNRRKNNLTFWNFIIINENIIAIKNKDNCYLKKTKSKIYCNSPSFNQATKFKIIRIYVEVNEGYNYGYYKLMKNEPIDILIKYIDLKDSNLNRKGIHQIEKDNDNEELRYSVRSILNYIPWVRKIFVLMPNEKVRFFKDYNLIKEKIIYIKDKDLLGYDSANQRAFQFRYWKLKKFGISENIILMDDDYFIGKELEKKNFFFVKDRKVIPSIITSNFLKLDKKYIKENLELYRYKAKQTTEEQNGDIFSYGKFLTLSFVFKLFNISANESIFVPNFTHNALPINLKDVKELYDLIFNSKYKYTTLDCLYRHFEGLQFQILYLSYFFLKYNRPVRNIPNRFIQLNDSILGNYKSSLFCINKGAGNYSYLKFYNEKILMEYLFPKPTPYEIIDYSLLNLSFDVAYSANEKLKFYEKQMSQMITKKNSLNLEIELILIFIFVLIKVNLKKKN